MKNLFLFLIFSLPNVIFSQNTIGILCTDFQVNNENKDIGKDFRKTFESVLANLEYSPMIIEREKLSDLLLKIQEEENLYRDFNKGPLKETLESAKVDYIVYGNFNKHLTNDKYEFHLEFVKISGKSSLSKMVLPILRFTEKELQDSELFEKSVKKMLNNYAFSKDFGIVENEQLNKINKRLDEKDKEIKDMKTYIEKERIKNDSLEKRKLSIPYFEARMVITDDSILSIQIKSNSNTPFKYKYLVFNEAGVSVIGGRIFLNLPILYHDPYFRWQEVYTHRISKLNDIDFRKPSKIILTVQNESIYFEETGNKELSQFAKKVYLFDFNSKTLKELTK